MEDHADSPIWESGKFVGNELPSWRSALSKCSCFLVYFMCAFRMFNLFIIDRLKYDLNYYRSTKYSKFDPTGVRTHDLQIMTVQFIETPALTTRPSVTYKPTYICQCVSFDLGFFLLLL